MNLLFFQGLERPRRPAGAPAPVGPHQVRVRLADGLRLQGLDPLVHPGHRHARRADAVCRVHQEDGSHTLN